MNGFVVAFVCSFAASIPVLALLRRFSVIDHPTSRSSHTAPTPRGGGIAVTCGLVIALFSVPSVPSTVATPLVFAACGLGALGLADDLGTFGSHPLSLQIRLALQAVLALVLFVWLLDDLRGPTAWQVLFAVGVWLWIAAYVNAYNFMDGINGIAATQAIVAGGTWWLVGAHYEVSEIAVGGAILAGAALGFIPFNYPRARMFLGDVGSYALGGWIAVLVVVALRSGLSLVAVLAPVSIALADTGFTIVRRARQREPLFQAHRTHAYQRLVAGGWSHASTTAFAGVAISCCSALGIAAMGRSDVVQIGLALGVFGVDGVYLSMPKILESRSSSPRDHGYRRLERLSLTLRTVRHLRPTQIVHRMRLRATRRLIARAPSVLRAERSTQSPGWPGGFQGLDAHLCWNAPSARDNARGVFVLAGCRLDLGNPIDWSAPGASQLWRFHLHYFEWAWALAREPDSTWARQTFTDLWRSWEAASPIGSGDAWSPYVASLRSWVLCSIWDSLIADSPVEAAVHTSLARHARYLWALRERDVGGNHLLKNLKALVGLGVFLGNERDVDKARRELRAQLDVQILTDGGHYERSPSYHCQVLGDLLDIEALLDLSKHPPVAGLAAAISRMQRWLGAMLLPDGTVPLFNDCVPVAPARLKCLGITPRREGHVTTLQPSGYVIVAGLGPWHVVMDVGPPCPDDLPAHAHADALSLVVAVNGRLLLTDAGTSTYELGHRRDHERSTAAHNTLEVDGASQSEVWDRFRVGHRASVHDVEVTSAADLVVVRASHDGYSRLEGSVIHRREIRVTTEELRVDDSVTGDGAHVARVRWHLAPDVASSLVPMRLGPLDVTVSAMPEPHTVELQPSFAATGFGQIQPSTTLCIGVDGSAPLSVRTSFKRGSP